MYSPSTHDIETPEPQGLVMAACTVAAGFPSPAEDYAQERVDLNKLVVQHPACTFLVQAAGHSMRDAGISDGDLLVVDRVLEAKHGDIVIAYVEDEFTVKFLHKKGGAIKLCPANSEFSEIIPKDGQLFILWGVVTAIVKLLKKPCLP